MEINNKKLSRSFKKVKRDILDLQNRLIDIERKQDEYMDILSKLFEKDVNSNKVPDNKVFIASKTGKVFMFQVV